MAEMTKATPMSMVQAILKRNEQHFQNLEAYKATGSVLGDVVEDLADLGLAASVLDAQNTAMKEAAEEFWDICNSLLDEEY